MHQSVLDFGAEHITREMVEGKLVLEVGSLNVNGSLRPHVERLAPDSYQGIDVVSGPGVDVLADITNLDEVGVVARPRLGLLICTEMLEHCLHWRQAVCNMKRFMLPGGWLILTTRSVGFARHHEPDYWRFSLDDMRRIFADFDIAVLMEDPGGSGGGPGVFLKARKPIEWQECDLSGIEVYSMENE